VVSEGQKGLYVRATQKKEKKRSYTSIRTRKDTEPGEIIKEKNWKGKENRKVKGKNEVTVLLLCLTSNLQPTLPGVYRLQLAYSIVRVNMRYAIPPTQKGDSTGVQFVVKSCIVMVGCMQ